MRRVGCLVNDSLWVRAYPVCLVLLVYLPAALLGVLLFRDVSSLEFLVLLVVFSGVYIYTFGFFARVYACLVSVLGKFFHVSRRLWVSLAVTALLIYMATMVVAIWISESIPLLVALQGGSVMEIAHARSQFLAGLVGWESLLRYSAFIMGRSVMPLILVAAFVLQLRGRYLLMALLLGLSVLAMEKAAPIFVLLPLVFNYAMKRNWVALTSSLSLMLVGVLMVSFLAMGGNAKSTDMNAVNLSSSSVAPAMSVPEGMPIQEAMGDPARYLLPYYLHNYFNDSPYHFNPHVLPAKVTLLLNRIGWVPYITAYDWLEFHRVVMHGKLTMGRSISFVHLLYGEPKMQLEKMVYVYEYGASPGGGGASNTIFFVDAKLAFGWLGVVIYCLVFTFCAACIFSSGSHVLVVSSVVCFFIASVSSLTATLLSGGLFIYVVLSLLLGCTVRENTPI